MRVCDQRFNYKLFYEREINNSKIKKFFEKLVQRLFNQKFTIFFSKFFVVSKKISIKTTFKFELNKIVFEIENNIVTIYSEFV